MASPPATVVDGTRPIRFFPGVGPKRAELFERIGIHTVEQLLRHYPRTHLDARRFVSIRELAPGGVATVVGKVRHAAAMRRRGRTDLVVQVDDDSGTIPVYFFGQSFLARTLRPGVQVVLSGELDPFIRRLVNPLFEVIEGDLENLLHAGRLVPVHALTKGLAARGMRSAMRRALDEAADRVPDPLPAEVVSRRRLSTLGEALRQIHFPESEAALEAARERLAFEELFLLQVVLELRRRVLQEEGRGVCTAGEGRLAAEARRALPFELTGEQDHALSEVVADMRAPRPMHRLLVGDVGSGKTAVAVLAALHAIEAGFQVAFLVPTEILAQQHAERLRPLLEGVGRELHLLTGATPATQRRGTLERLGEGAPVLLVGTHALLEESVAVPKLGLAVVDEQHRFGVKQRATLAKKSVIPDVLVLSATPIPRTLALTLYGDLDLSVLRHRPPGRGRLVTRLAGEEKLPLVIEFLARELEAGRQAYVVVPAIEEGRGEARGAEAEMRRLSADPLLERFRIGLLHGRLRPDAKQAAMEGFARGEIQVLVTTTVVEVGVDVANATLMVVEHADRFGLTQLHQLRGRVGRGEHRSVCVLVPGPGCSALGRARLEELVRTDDGFEIAEADLKTRGPGEPWGLRQSGLPRFKLADPLRDAPLVEAARSAARELVVGDPGLTDARHAILRAAMLTHYREPLELALAG